MSDNRCVFCGEQIPEGTMVCSFCRGHYGGDKAMLEDILQAQKQCDKIEKIESVFDKIIVPIIFLLFVIYFIFFYN